jgi:hypothetical protein
VRIIGTLHGGTDHVLAVDQRAVAIEDDEFQRSTPGDMKWLDPEVLARPGSPKGTIPLWYEARLCNAQAPSKHALIPDQISPRCTRKQAQIRARFREMKAEALRASPQNRCQPNIPIPLTRQRICGFSGLD